MSEHLQTNPLIAARDKIIQKQLLKISARDRARTILEDTVIPAFKSLADDFSNDPGTVHVGGSAIVSGPTASAEEEQLVFILRLTANSPEHKLVIIAKAPWENLEIRQNSYPPFPINLEGVTIEEAQTWVQDLAGHAASINN